MTPESSSRSSRLRTPAALIVSALTAALLVVGVPTASNAEVVAQQTGVISGVLTVAGSSTFAAGVDVELAREDPNDAGSIQIVDVRSTAEDGSYSFSGLDAGVYQLSVIDPQGRYASDSRFGIQLDDGGEVIESIELTELVSFTVSGQVTFAGTPEPGVEVYALDVEQNTLLGPEITDGDGRYSISGISGNTVQVSACGSDSAYVYFVGPELNIDDNGATYDFSVERVPTGPGSITGVVTDRVSGLPIEGVEVRVSSQEVPGLFRFVFTDGNGAYSVTNLPFATYELGASKDVFEDAEGPGYDFLSVFVLVSEANQNRTRDIALTATIRGEATLSGVVEDETGQPIPFASLSLAQSSGGFEVSTTNADENGNYLLTDLAPGSYRLFASGPNDDNDQPIFFTPATYDPAVEIADATSAVTKTVVLQRYATGTASLSGVLSDTRTGDPIANAEVFLFSFTFGNRDLSTVTDELGQWSFSHLPAGLYSYRFSPLDNPESYEIGPQIPLLEIADAEVISRLDALTSVVPGTATVEGRVRDAVTHVGIAGAEIFLSRDGGGYVAGPITSDDSGRYFAENLPAGRYFVSASANGYVDAAGGVEVAGGPETLNLPMRASVVPLTGDGVITGIVLNGSLEPVANAFITIFDSGPDAQGVVEFATTDGDGRFEVGNLAFTQWTVRVDAFGAGPSLAPGEDRVTLSDRQPSAEVELLVLPAASIAGTVDLSARPPGESLSIEAIAIDAETGAARSSAFVDERTGEYRIPGLPAGQYLVWFVQPSNIPDQSYSMVTSYWSDELDTGVVFADSATTVEVSSGEDRVGVDFRVQAGAAISGSVRVATSDGTAPLGAGKAITVTVSQLVRDEWIELDQPTGVAASFTRGEFLLQGLAPGSYRLEFTDFFEGARSLATAFNGGGMTFDDAPIIEVGAGESADGEDVVMSVRQPDADPPTLVLDDFGDGLAPLEGQIGIDEQLETGDTTEVVVGRELAGEWVTVWANSEPTKLTEWVQVSSAGTIPVTLPATLLGEHRIAVQDADSGLFGWKSVTIAADSTGPEGPGGGDTGGETGGGDTGGGDTGVGAENPAPGTGGGTSAPGTETPGTNAPRTSTGTDPTAPSAGTPDSAAGDETSTDDPGADSGGSEGGSGDTAGGSDGGDAPGEPEAPDAAEVDATGGVSPVLVASIIGLVIAALIVAGVLIARRRAA